MARGKAAFGLSKLLIVLAVILLLGMIFFSPGSIVSAFEDLGSECIQGEKPCDEGYFCNVGKCVSIYPKATGTPDGYRQGVDIS
jgi:hypothetical protein